MIKDGQGISAIFSIFHDGIISNHNVVENKLELEIEVSYLAQYIDRAYTTFFLSLYNARDFSFDTWPHDVDAVPAAVRDLSQIFAGEPGILSSEFKNGLIEVVMSQDSRDADYSGGILSFKADAARVIDEGGKQYDVRELRQISKEYWDKFSNINNC